MSVLLTKLLSLLVYPLSLGLLVVLAGVVLSRWRKRLAWWVVGAGVLVIWVPSTPLVGHWLRGTLERPYPPVAVKAAPSADAIVVLGGGVGAAVPPRLYPDLSDAADRVWHAARLYRAGKAPYVIASGGTLPWFEARHAEAPALERLLAAWGVPRDSILVEASSATTYENARNTRRIVRTRGMQRVLLVTSAFHMRRALATFRAAGVSAVPIATDHRAVEDRPFTLLDLLPDVGALADSTLAVKEYVGYWYYAWRGWI